MTNNINTILKRARKIRLGKYERAHLKNEFMAYTDQYSAQSGTYSAWTVFVALLRSPAPYVTAGMLLVVTGTGLSYAAQNALPGDFLYPVKVSFTEEMYGLLQNTPESQAIYEAHRANERLEEIERLALSGGIEPSAWSELSEKVDVHVRNVTEYVETSENAEEAHRINSRLKSVLNVHGDVLRKVSERIEEKGDVLHEIINDIAKKESNAESLQKRIELGLANSDSKKLRDLATSTHATAQGELDSVNAVLDAQADVFKTLAATHTDPITSRLDRANRSYASGTDAYREKQYGKAFIHFIQTQQFAEEIKMLIDAEESLQLNTSVNATSTPNGTGEDIATSTTATSSVSGSSTNAGPSIGTSTASSSSRTQEGDNSVASSAAPTSTPPKES